jgi:hypothetical protein
MTDQATTKPAKTARLFWIKYNPQEWQGMYSELSDEEYGLFHRIMGKLWATPGNRLTLPGLITDLRIKAGSRRHKVLLGLIGYALKEDADGKMYITAIDEAFSAAIDRSKSASFAAKAKHDQATTV